MRTFKLITLVALFVALPVLATLESVSAKPEVQNYIDEGMECERKGQLEDAAQAYEKAIRAEPNSAYAHMRLGSVYRLLERSKKALPELQKAVELNPQDPAAHFYLGRLQWEMGETNDAKATLQKGMGVAPDRVDCMVLYAVILKNEGKVQEAIDILKEAIKKDPQSFGAHVTLGNVYAERNLWPEANSEFLDAIRIDTSQPETQRNLGLSYIHLGKLDLAVKHLNSAIRLDGQYAIAYYNLAEAYELQGLKGEAVWNYNRYLETSNPELDIKWRQKAQERIIALEAEGVKGKRPK